MDDTPLSNSRSYAPPERLRVSIELTNICNFACPFCPQAYKHDALAPGGSPYNRRQGLMSRAVFARAVDECNRVAETVELGFFGEQTLHPEYLERVRSLATRSFTLEASTNVSYVTREMMQAWIDARRVRAARRRRCPLRRRRPRHRSRRRRCRIARTACCRCRRAAPVRGRML